MNIRPLHDRLVVQRIAEKTESAGGIIIPDAVAERPNRAKVIAVGKGKALDDGFYRAMSVEVGDTVLFESHAGSELIVDGAEYLVLREDDVMGLVD